MAQYQAIEAHRPLVDVGWVEQVEEAAQEIFEPGTFDFQQGELARKGIILLGVNEQISMCKKHGTLGYIATDQLVSTAGRNLPGSFQHEVSPNLKKPGIQMLEGGPRNATRRLLVAQVSLGRTLKEERKALTETIDQSARQELPWASHREKIWLPLATIVAKFYISNKELQELRESFPATVHAKEGEINRIPIRI